MSIASPFLLLAVSGCLPSALIAQAASPATKGPLRYELTVPANATIGGFVQEIRTKTGANIAVDTGVARIWLPSLQLKGVTVAGALAWIPSTRLAREAGVRIEPSRAGQDSNVVYVVTRFGEGRIGPQGSVRAYSVSNGTTRELNADQLEKAIRNAIEKRNLAPLPPGVYREPGTGLLFVTGAQDDVELATQIVTEATRGQRAANADLQEQIQALRRKVDSLDRRLSQRDTIRKP